MIPTLSRRRPSRAVPSLLCAVFLTAQALAQPAPAVRPDPLDPGAAVPALRYESALAQYRRLGDEKTASWRDANDAVARIGGWRAYAREARQPEAPASAPALPAAKPSNGLPSDVTRKPVPAGHGGHQQP